MFTTPGNKGGLKGCCLVENQGGVPPGVGGTSDSTGLVSLRLGDCRRVRGTCATSGVEPRMHSMKDGFGAGSFGLDGPKLLFVEFDILAQGCVEKLGVGRAQDDS